MSKKDIRHDRLNLPAGDSAQPSPDLHLARFQGDGAIILVTQAYGPQGHNLVRPDNTRFDGYPGVAVQVETEIGHKGIVVLSPFHGDPTKAGMEEIPSGTPCRVSCPECSEELLAVGDCSCGGKLHALYLSARLSEGDYALICDRWNCHRSRVVDGWDILSEVIDEEDAAADGEQA